MKAWAYLDGCVIAMYHNQKTENDTAASKKQAAALATG
jgi:hypothetical protein